MIVANRFPMLTMAAVALLFGSVLFSVNNLLLERATASWRQVLAIQGSFAPSLDPRALYQAASSTKAVEGRGAELANVPGDGKIGPYDGRIIQQAAQERQLRVPPVFFQGLPGS